MAKKRLFPLHLDVMQAQSVPVIAWQDAQGCLERAHPKAFAPYSPPLEPLIVLPSPSAMLSGETGRATSCQGGCLRRGIV